MNPANPVIWFVASVAVAAIIDLIGAVAQKLGFDIRPRRITSFMAFVVQFVLLTGVFSLLAMAFRFFNGQILTVVTVAFGLTVTYAVIDTIRIRRELRKMAAFYTQLCEPAPRRDVDAHKAFDED